MEREQDLRIVRDFEAAAMSATRSFSEGRVEAARSTLLVPGIGSATG